MPYPQSPLLLLCAAALLVLFTTVASVDGLYFHLHRYRLHELPASRAEHRLHTLNALLFPPLTFLLYCVQPAGAALWLAALLFTLTVAVEAADVLIEHRSRAPLGGLLPAEYCMHFFMSGLRWGMVLPLLLSPPAAAWAVSATGLGARPLWLAIAGWSVALPAIAIAALHVALDRRGRTTPSPRGCAPGS